MKLPKETDFLVIGGGIAGASVAYWLAPHAQVVLLEREAQPGYHTTGRSAALFSETYGPPQVRALTSASRAFLQQPPAGFSEHPLLTPRGSLFVARDDQLDMLRATYQRLRAQSAGVAWLPGDEVARRVPVMRPEHAVAGISEPDAADIDVHGLLTGWLRGLRHAGGNIVLDAPVSGMTRCGAGWLVETAACTYRAAVVINAAGAWADEVAAMAGVAPSGLRPLRRSAFTFTSPAATSAHWPAVINVAEDYYFKPDAGVLLGSCANADLSQPADVQPEELDIAQGIHEIEQATTMTIRRPLHTWAGLRSFVPSGDLLAGYDARQPGFFWLAGQGGYGIQTCAAMGQACAALALGRDLPDALLAAGVQRSMLLPGLLPV